MDKYKPELNVKYFIDPYGKRGSGFYATINTISDVDVFYETQSGSSLRCSIKEWKEHMWRGVIKKDLQA